MINDCKHLGEFGECACSANGFDFCTVVSGYDPEICCHYYEREKA